MNFWQKLSMKLILKVKQVITQLWHYLFIENSVQEEANSDVEEETSNEKPSEDESCLANKMKDFKDMLGEELRKRN